MLYYKDSTQHVNKVPYLLTLFINYDKQIQD